MTHPRNSLFGGGHLGGVAGWVLAVALAAGFSALGWWQYGRAMEKRALVDGAAAVLDTRSPVPLSAAADAGRAQRLEWAAGTGRFADAGPFLLDNQRHEGRVGVRAYRVFLPVDGDTPLLVDLGWLPLGGDRAMPAVPRPEGTLAVRGLLAPPPSPGLPIGEGIAPGGDGWLLTRVEPVAIARAARLPVVPAPRVLRLDPALPIGHARDLEVLPNTLPPERHLGYAVQWFGLAAAVLVVAVVLSLRRRRHPTGKDTHTR